VWNRLALRPTISAERGVLPTERPTRRGNALTAHEIDRGVSCLLARAYLATTAGRIEESIRKFDAARTAALRLESTPTQATGTAGEPSARQVDTRSAE